MSDFENGCAGSCDACGSKSDCEKATVTLTLDDGSMMECAILTIRHWITSKVTKNMKWLRMHSMNGWIMQNLKIWKTNLFHGAIFLCMLKSPAGFCL